MSYIKSVLRGKPGDSPYYSQHDVTRTTCRIRENVNFLAKIRHIMQSGGLSVVRP